MQLESFDAQRCTALEAPGGTRDFLSFGRRQDCGGRSRDGCRRTRGYDEEREGCRN
jgi:hypothetical protein